MSFANQNVERGAATRRDICATNNVIPHTTMEPMTAPSLRGSARIEYQDYFAYRVFMLKRRGGLLILFFLIFAAMFINKSIAHKFAIAQATGGSEMTVVLGGLLEVTLIGVVGFAVAFIILLGIDGLNLTLLGKQRRVIEYEADDTKIVTHDALGAELSLPWSNIRNAVFKNRLLMLQIKPRGWRFVMLRAFKAAEVVALHEITVRGIK